MLDFIIPQRRRARYIDGYYFESPLLSKFQKKYPQLHEEQIRLVESGLKQYFKVALAANGLPIIMPSRVVDDLWHEFILFTKEYHQFCFKGLGRFLHHVPDKEQPASPKDSKAYARTWFLACELEGIYPFEPDRLPLIFGIDALLDIPEGVHHKMNEALAIATQNKPYDSKSTCSACSSITHSSEKNSQDNSFLGSIFSDSSCSSGCSGCGGCGGD